MLTVMHGRSDIWMLEGFHHASHRKLLRHPNQKPAKALTPQTSQDTV